MASVWRATVLRTVERIGPLRRNLLASCDYQLIETPSANGGQDMGEQNPGWVSRRTAARQDRAWQRITRRALDGDPREDVAAVLDAIATEGRADGTVLEVGCGSGYFGELIGHSFPAMTYVGVDNSEAMIALARSRRPQADHRHGDATALPFDDKSFDLTLDGAALIHIPDWRSALAEYDRVTEGPIVLSSLTVSDLPRAQMLRKLAYGSPVLELIFSRQELRSCLADIGRTVVSQVPTLDYDLAHYVGIPTTSELWVCR
jgi:ubiquinone/menaquinone biosynthesis C-methylase UbiE